MSYVDNHLLEKEHILYRAQMHWIIFFFPTFWTVLTVAFSLSPSVVALLAYVTGILAIYYWFNAGITFSTSAFAVTNKRVIVKYGLIQRHSLEIFLQKVEGIQVSQSIVGRLLNYGTVTIIGTGGTRDPFAMISDPLVFRRKVQNQIEKSISPKQKPTLSK